ncbi:hypothetical protein GCM10010256_50970 [Streptomyces coeruleorubidus]|nr:hypothetical protein GCM10010256_50970 [Streptomyces coeruleorubidus]
MTSDPAIGGKPEAVNRPAPGRQVQRGGRVGGDDVDDGAGLCVGDLVAQAQQEGDAEQAAPSKVMPGAWSSGSEGFIGGRRWRR